MTDAYYRSPAWLALRAAALARDGGRCVVPGCGQRAVVVDHITGRRAGGGDTLSNLRSLCRAHDNQAKEGALGTRRSGGRFTVAGCDASGTPRDPAHWWNENRSELRGSDRSGAPRKVSLAQGSD
jgi:hypothetical protein